jgi:hypothetical protein
VTTGSSAVTTRPALPPLPLEEWEQTKETLHLWVQIVGKIRMATSPPRNHWWHVPLYVDVRGLTTRRLHAADGTSFQIDFDFVDHRLVVRTNRGESESFALLDELSVAAFDERLHATLLVLGLDVAIRETPYGIPTTPFPQDVDHLAYDADAVERFWRILDWTDGVFETYARWFCGKTSPVHLFWHSLDLAVTRFDGERSPDTLALGPVDREAYSHNVVSFGFWTGDRTVREPMFYAYAATEPAGLPAQPLRPDDAHWVERGGGSLALLSYEAVRTAPDPRTILLSFLKSAYRAGSVLAGWDREELRSAWSPAPRDLHKILVG